MNIFLRELRANLKSLLIWCGFIVFFIYMGMAKFSAFAADDSMLEILDGLPEALIALMRLEQPKTQSRSGQ